MRSNTNKYIFNADCVEIITRKNQHIIIDHEDFEKCKSVSWCVDNRGYANGRNAKIGTVRLHRFILNVPADKQVDHINRDKLDNRKSNLRIVTNQENHFNEGLSKNNSSGVKGVYYNKDCDKWVCQITLNGKTIYGGLFDNLKMAVSKRKSLEEKYHQIYRR